MKGLSFTLCWVSLPTPFYLRSKHLCQLCASFLICLHIALFILLYVHNYPWGIHVESWSNCWSYYLTLCWYKHFHVENCCYFDLSLMLDYYISKCFIVLFMKVCTCVITYAYSLFTCLQTIDYWLGSLHSDHVDYTIIWSKFVLVACHFKNYLFLSFTYSRTSRN